LLTHEHAQLQDILVSMASEQRRIASDLLKLMKLNVMNDCFYVWFSGPFATINNFRLGKLPTHIVEWPEINAALGEATLAVSSMQTRIGLEFKKYAIVPMGSFSKVHRVDDKRNLLNLFWVDGTLMFQRRNFNAALTGLLCCVNDIGDHISNHDPTIQMPYEINTSEAKINGHSILYNSDDEQWTRACKYLLTNIKWMIAWSAKHCTFPQV
jgi:beclin 1